MPELLRPAADRRGRRHGRRRARRGMPVLLRRPDRARLRPAHVPPVRRLRHLHDGGGRRCRATPSTSRSSSTRSPPSTRTAPGSLSPPRPRSAPSTGRTSDRRSTCGRSTRGCSSPHDLPACPPDDADPLYLVPHGTFLLHPPAQESAPALLCGVGGAEYIELAAPSTLAFAAGNPAYAPDFDPAQNDAPGHPGPAADRPGVHGLGIADRRARRSGTSPSPRARRCSGRVPRRRHRRRHHRCCRSSMSGPPRCRRRPTRATVAYPLVPHAGATEDLTSYERLEVQVLSQQRRQVIHDLPAAPEVPRARRRSPWWPGRRDRRTRRRPRTPSRPRRRRGSSRPSARTSRRWTSLQIAQSVQQLPAPAVTRRFALQDVADPLQGGAADQPAVRRRLRRRGVPALRRPRQRDHHRRLPLPARPGDLVAARHDPDHQERPETAVRADRRHQHLDAGHPLQPRRPRHAAAAAGDRRRRRRRAPIPSSPRSSRCSPTRRGTVF